MSHLIHSVVYFVLDVAVIVLCAVIVWIGVVVIAAIVSTTFDTVRGHIRRHRKEHHVSRP